MMRLQSLAPEIAGELQRASMSKRHAVAAIACQLAVSQTGVDHPAVKHALDELLESKPIGAAEVRELESIAEELDERYFALQDAIDAGQGDPEQCMKMFNRARAVSALVAAAGVDALIASSEAIYEAATAVDDQNDFFVIISATLRN